jgi:hypothetical protein
MKRLFTLLFFIASLGLAQGQIAFTNSTHLLSNSDFHSGVAIAVADMNGDGLDDIVRLSQGRAIHIEYQQPGDVFLSYVFGEIAATSQWSICVADVDNSGYNDILVGGRYDKIKFLRADANGTDYEMAFLPGANMFIQASNLADINNDGFIDFFACHDDGESRIWGNDGSGNLIEADEWIDMATVPPSDNSGNYGSVWTDFDNDGDLDLYIAKCRQGVNNPLDPRRINALYVNDGEGNFTEMAEAYGLKIGHQSWTAEFQDIDNDGDLDCFITNHDAPSQLLENDGTGVFTDITSSSGINVSGLPIQAIFRDFDNDGFVDLLVTGTQTNLFRNNGNKTFTKIVTVFDNNQIESFALGDLNNDGFVDVYAGYAQVYTTPSNIDDALWLNNGNDNHFLTVRLIGQESNRNGIGARLELYGPWGLQIREVRAGESYGITNSMSQHFGLGLHETADSLIIRWPSGNVDIYENLIADQFLTIIETTCVSPQVDIVANGPTTFCSGESLELEAPDGFATYLWSNGESTPSVTVAASGSYNVTVSDGSECFGVSNFINIIVDPDETPYIAALGDTVFCLGGSVELMASEAESYQWSTGETGSSIMATQSGDYTVAVQGLCEVFTSAPIIVNALVAPAPEVQNDTIFEPGTAALTAVGANLSWFDVPEGGEPLASGPEFITPFIEETTTFYVENLENFFGGTFFTGPPAHTGPTNFSGNAFNAQIIFDCHNPFTLKTVKVYTDTPGKRKIILLDSDLNLLHSKEIDIPEGEHDIELDFDVEPGVDLILTTDTQNNIQEFGFASPRLRRSENFSGFPFVIEELVTIKETNFGTNLYYYFYNWEVVKPSIDCLSERVGVEAVVDIPNYVKDPDAGRIRVFPNPGQTVFFVERNAATQGAAILQLFDTTGKLLRQEQWQAQENRHVLHVEKLPAGLYLLRYFSGEEVYSYKLLKE